MNYREANERSHVNKSQFIINYHDRSQYQNQYFNGNKSAMSQLEKPPQQIQLFDSNARPTKKYAPELSQNVSQIQTAEASSRLSNNPKPRHHTNMQSAMTNHTTAAATNHTEVTEVFNNIAGVQSVKAEPVNARGQSALTNYQTMNHPSAEPKTKFIKKGDTGRSIGGFDQQSFASRGFRSNAKSTQAKSSQMKSGKRKIGWDDYFQSKMGAPPQNEMLGSYNYKEQGKRTDYQCPIKNLHNQQIRQIVDVQKPVNNKMDSVVFSAVEGQKDPYMDHTILAQRKAPSAYTPATLQSHQTWTDLMARTLANNQITNRQKANESLKSTKRMLQPELQPEVDNRNNKITGCDRKRFKNSSHQTFKIGQKIEQDMTITPKGQLFQQNILKSRIFDNLMKQNEIKSQYLHVHPNTLMSDNVICPTPQPILRTQEFRTAAGANKNEVLAHHHRNYKTKMDIQSKVSCIPNSLTLQSEQPMKIKKRAKSLNHIRNMNQLSENMILFQQKESDNFNPLHFQVFNVKQNAVVGNQKRKTNQAKVNRIFGSQLQFAEPESEAHTRNDRGRVIDVDKSPIRQIGKQSRSVTAKKGGLDETCFSIEFQNQVTGKKQFELNKTTFDMKKVNEQFNTIQAQRKRNDGSRNYQNRSQITFEHSKDRVNNAVAHRAGSSVLQKAKRNELIRDPFKSQFKIS